MQLVGSLTSPFSRKVRICFIEKEISYSLLLEDGWNINTKLYEINPLGKIPCLLLSNDHPIFDSSVMAFPRFSRQLILSTMNQGSSYEANQIHN